MSYEDASSYFDFQDLQAEEERNYEKRLANQKWRRGLATAGLLVTLGVGGVMAGVGEKAGAVAQGVKDWVDQQKTEHVEKGTVREVLTPTSVVPTETPRPTVTVESSPTIAATSTPESKSKIDRSEKFEGFVVYFDQNDSPISYKTDDGIFHEIDQTKFHSILETAKESGEPELLEVVTLPLRSEIEPQVNTKEHPVYTELPDVALSPEKLKELGITIYQAPGVELYLNEAAVKKGGPLESFPKDGRELHIVLVNSAVTSREGLQEGYKYPQHIIDTLAEKEESLEAFREGRIEQIRGLLEKEQAALKQARKDNDLAKIALKELSVGEYKALLRGTELATEQELILLTTGGGTDAVGLYDHPGILPSVVENHKQQGKAYKDINPATIYIAVGQEMPEKMSLIVYPNGKVKADRLTSTGLTNVRKPGRKGSFFNPHSITLKSVDPRDKDTYAVRGDLGTSWVLAHEMGHDKGKAQESLNGRRPDIGEAFADTAALEMLKKGWDRWEQSGFTDNSESLFSWKVLDARTGKWSYTVN